MVFVVKNIVFPLDWSGILLKIKWVVIVRRWLWVGKGVQQAAYCLIGHPLFIISHFHSLHCPNHCIVRGFIAIHISLLDAQQTPSDEELFMMKFSHYLHETLHPHSILYWLRFLTRSLPRHSTVTGAHCLPANIFPMPCLHLPTISFFSCLSNIGKKKLFSAFTLSYISSCYSLVHTRGMPTCMS